MSKSTGVLLIQKRISFRIQQDSQMELVWQWQNLPIVWDKVKIFACDTNENK